MKSIQIYDPPMCCSSGVCGVEVDQALVDFSANIEWAKQQGAKIERFNLAQQPTAFAENAVVKGLLDHGGQNVLPITLLNKELVLAGRYPSRDDLARWMGLQSVQNSEPEQSTKSPGCDCSGARCC